MKCIKDEIQIGEIPKLNFSSRRRYSFDGGVYPECTSIGQPSPDEKLC